MEVFGERGEGQKGGAVSRYTSSSMHLYINNVQFSLCRPSILVFIIITHRQAVYIIIIPCLE